MSKTVAVDTEKNANLCYGVTMMNNETTMTFQTAISVLESEFDSIYRGVKTVSEMCTSLTDAISWEGESPDAIYHQFETKVGANKIVREDQVIALAKHYA